MKKLMTIVTSTYNKGDRNRISVQSILNQTFKDFEYIVINDGSPDNTKEILDQFHDVRLKIIHQKNQGFIKTMVSVMDEIETPYVAIHGAGDISLPKRLEKQLEYLETKRDVGVVSCQLQQVQEQDIVTLGDFKEFKDLKKAKKIEYNTVEQMIRSNIVDHGEAMIRMSAYREAGGYRSFFRYVQDRDLWLRILEKYSIVKLDSLLYLKVTNPKFDISGNPKKSEEQALFSLFARYLAQERIISGRDLLKEYGEKSFVNFAEELDDSSKEEIIDRVFRNTIKNNYSDSSSSAEKAIEIIQRYSSNHKTLKSLKTYRFFNKNVPYGCKIYYMYFHKIKANFKRVKAKLNKLFEKPILIHE